jgi:hypothetical protein
MSDATEIRTWLIEWFRANGAGVIPMKGHVTGPAETELVLMAFNLNKLAWELADRIAADDKAD